MLRKIDHLIRYFIILGILTFVGYLKNFHDDIFLALIGPPLYLAHGLKKLVTSTISTIPSTHTVIMFAFLLPVTLLYFGLTGFQLKQLWNERGKTRTLILIVFIGFLTYIHYTAWKNLSAYIVEI